MTNRIKSILIILTNFSGHGKSNSFTIPKSSPVTMLRPEWDTQAQLTSAFSVLRDQIPTTSSPRTLDTEKEREVTLKARTLLRPFLHTFVSSSDLTLSRWSRWSCQYGSALWPASRMALRTRVVYKHLLISVSKRWILEVTQRDKPALSIMRSVPARKRCQQRSPSASRSWGCPCSSWCGSAADPASGRRSRPRSQWSLWPSSESSDWTWKKGTQEAGVLSDQLFTLLFIFHFLFILINNEFIL